MVRQAVIVAAGRGSRLSNHDSKPLMNVGGMPLIKRVALSAIAGGIDEVVVVTGFLGEQLRCELSADADLAPYLRFVHNDRWHDLANGYSLLCAREVVAGEFVLLMSDHIFDPATLRALVWHTPRPGCGVLAVDYKLETIFDMDDATKVQTRDGHIAAIGKDLARYDAVDTGMFRLPTSVFDSLAEAYETRGDCSLSDGIRRLAGTGRMQVFDIGHAWWQDVDTPESLRHAEWMLAREVIETTAPRRRAAREATLVA